MMDMMVQILSDKELHIRASKGFKRTAVAVDIDGGEDDLIKREALEAWNYWGMRKEINKEVAMVRAEVKANYAVCKEQL